MMTDIIRADLECELWERLEAVTDPELDEPVTELGFVERAAVIDGRRVEIDFRLPTYWCSPNFAFLMAIGLRRAALAAPWARQVRVTLHDHCFGEKVNAGVNSGRPFEAVFAEYCDGADLSAVIETFAAKAFDRRQEAMLLALEDLGMRAEEIVRLSLGAFDRIRLHEAEAARQKPRYREMLVARGLAGHPGDLAFPTFAGGPIAAPDLPDHMRRLRATRIGMTFNGALCRGLAATRYKEVGIGPDGPELIDFIAGRAPPRRDPALRG